MSVIWQQPDARAFTTQQQLQVAAAVYDANVCVTAVRHRRQLQLGADGMTGDGLRFTKAGFLELARQLVPGGSELLQAMSHGMCSQQVLHAVRRFWNDLIAVNWSTLSAGVLVFHTVDSSLIGWGVKRYQYRGPRALLGAVADTLPPDYQFVAAELAGPALRVWHAADGPKLSQPGWYTRRSGATCGCRGVVSVGCPYGTAVAAAPSGGWLNENTSDMLGRWPAVRKRVQVAIKSQSHGRLKGAWDVPLGFRVDVAAALHKQQRQQILLRLRRAGLPVHDSDRLVRRLVGGLRASQLAELTVADVLRLLLTVPNGCSFPQDRLSRAAYRVLIEGWIKER